MSRKNLNKSKYRDDAPDAPPKPPSPWEVKILFFVLRTIAVLFFLAYLSMTSYGAYSWTWIKWQQRLPLTDAVAVADKYLNQTGEPMKLTSWLRARPASEHDELIKLLDAYMPKMSPDSFFLFSHWESEEGKLDDARFWWMLGNFRLRFDLMRCGGQNAIANINDIMKIYAGKEYDRLFKNQPGALEASMQKVMDYDARNPARNDPTVFCTFIWQTMSADTSNLRPVPDYEWGSIRAGLRANSQRYLNQQNSKKADDKKTDDKTTPPPPNGGKPALEDTPSPKTGTGKNE